MVYKLFDYQHLKKLLLSISGFGVVVAVLGIAQYYLTPNKLYFVIVPPEEITKSFGTFYNPNNYAGFLTLALLPLAGFMGSCISERKLVRVLVSAISLGVGLFSIVLSGSAGGLVTYLGGLCFFILLYSLHKSVSTTYFNRFSHIVLWFAIPVVFAGFFLVIFNSEHFNDFYKNLLAPGFRGLVYRDSIEYFKGFFIFGSGLGTFSYIFPIYQSFYSSGFFVYAENEYLQLLVEMGIVGFGLLLIFALILFRSCIAVTKKSHGNLFLISLGLISAILAALSHNLAEFGFHVPPITLLLFIYAASIFKLEKITNQTTARLKRKLG